jgi:hypothetical protein
MATRDRADLQKIIQFLGRFVPVVSRGLALGFAILAIATAFLGMGDHAGSTERALVSGLYGLIALASLAVGLAVRQILRRIAGKP